MMKPMMVTTEEGEEITYACIQWRNFPSRFAKFDIKQLRQENLITPVEVQSHDVWVRECNVTEMTENKCLSCTHCRRLVVAPREVPKLVKLDGSKGWAPAVDLTTFEQVGHYRATPKPKSR